MDHRPQLISREEATRYLEQVGLRIGDWNEIRRLEGAAASQWHSAQILAPSDANSRLTLALHAVSWLPFGPWQLLQLDNSNSFSRIEKVLLSSLISGPGELIDFNSPEASSILFRFEGDLSEKANTALIISHLVRALLDFEAHAYIASSGTTIPQCLGIQDGVVQFLHSSEAGLAEPRELVAAFQLNPRAYPQWVVDFIERDQLSRMPQ